MKALKEALIEILLANKLLTQEQLDARSRFRNLKEYLYAKFWSRREWFPRMSFYLCCPPGFISFLHLSKYKFDVEIVKLIPEHTARQYCVISAFAHGAYHYSAMADPFNISLWMI